MLNIHAFFSPIVNESRIEKEVGTLLTNNVFKKIIILGYWKEGLVENEVISEQFEIHRIKLPVHTTKKTGIIKSVLALFSVLIFFKFVFYKCIKLRPSFLSVHNPTLLPVASLVKKKIKTKIIYVPHELETERAGLVGLFKRITKFVERKYIYDCDGMTVVSEPIKNWYAKYYKICGIGVVPNIPINPNYKKEFIRKKLFREEFKISDNDLIFIYQGLLSKGRGLDILIKVFSSISKNKHLVIMGYGEMEEDIVKASSIQSNIHFKQAVKRDKIIDYTSSADVGLQIKCEEMTLSYKYSLPNKFYEYSIGRLYLIVTSNYTEQSRIINEQKLGASVKPTFLDLKNLINNISLGVIQQTVENSEKFRSNISWVNNEDVLIDVYKEKLKLKMNL